MPTTTLCCSNVRDVHDIYAAEPIVSNVLLMGLDWGGWQPLIPPRAGCKLNESILHRSHHGARDYSEGVQCNCSR